MSQSDLGPMPEPQAEPGDPNPGGVDAQPPNEVVLPADPHPELNPEVRDGPESSGLHGDLQEKENTSTSATRGEDAPENESPA